MRMSVGGRIALTIGVMVLLTVAAGLATYFAAKRLEGGIQRYANVDAPRERAAFQMQTNMAEYGRLVTLAASSADELPPELSDVAARFEAAATTFMKLPGNVELTGLGYELRSRIRQLDGQARLVLSSDGTDRRRAFRDFQQQFTDISKLLREEILPVVQQRGSKSVFVFQSLSRQPALVLALMVAAASLLGSMAAVVLLRGVVYPLSNILSQTTDFAAQGHDGLVEVVGDDEHGQLAAAINVVLEQKRASEQAIEDIAHRDPLTRLPNRQLFQERLAEMVGHARRIDRQTAVYIMDLDNFKDLNDSLGHAAGDELLLKVAERLKRVSRDTDIVARLGGDEFAIIQTNIDHPDGVLAFADRVINALTAEYEIFEKVLHTTVSLGITIFPDDDTHAPQLLQNAELALYRAKQDGRGRFQLFDATMQELAQKRHALEQEIRIALDNDDFEVHYQPRYRVADRTIVGAEALIRWTHKERGPISPGEFIPIAESSGLITKITEFVVQRASKQMAIWSTTTGLPLSISINLSPVDFRRPDIVQYIEQCLVAADLSPSQLEIEITEGMVMYGAELVRERLTELRALGVSLAIDDFGTGFSSMSYLKTFPVDSLKIDQSFVAGIPAQREDIAITMAIIRLAHSLQLTTVAEGVETDAQFEFLSRRNCDQVQGFLLSRPIPADAFAALLAEQEPVNAAQEDAG